jgi:hypothetical protein
MSDSNKFPFTCPKCSQRFSVTPPDPGVLNDLRASVVIAPHEKPIRCFKCGQEYCFIATAAQVSWAIQPLTEEQSELLRGSKIIPPPEPTLILQ